MFGLPCELRACDVLSSVCQSASVESAETLPQFAKAAPPHGTSSKLQPVKEWFISGVKQGDAPTAMAAADDDADDEADGGGPRGCVLCTLITNLEIPMSSASVDNRQAARRPCKLDMDSVALSTKS